MRDIFEAQPQTNGISGERLSNMLTVNGNGWATWYGRGITGRDIATMLKQYGVHSVNVRTDEGVRKGYRRADLYPVFDRYLPPVGTTPVADVAEDMEKAVWE